MSEAAKGILKGLAGWIRSFVGGGSRSTAGAAAPKPSPTARMSVQQLRQMAAQRATAQLPASPQAQQMIAESGNSLRQHGVTGGVAQDHEPKSPSPTPTRQDRTSQNERSRGYSR